MRNHMGCVAPALCAGLVLAFTAPAVSPAQSATNCLAAPNGVSPKGKHWFYRIDRANGRKCWYLGDVGTRPRYAAPAAESEQKPRRAAPAAPVRVKLAEPAPPPLLQNEAAISSESETANPDIWPVPEATPLRGTEAASPFRIADAAPPAASSPVASTPIQTWPAAEATVPAPKEAGPPVLASEPADSQAAPAQAATSSSVTALSLILLVVGMAIIGFLLRALYWLAMRGRIHVGREGRGAGDRPLLGRMIASPSLAPVDTEPRLEDMLRRLPRKSERRAA